MDVSFSLQLCNVAPVKFLVCAGTLTSAALCMSVVGSHRLLESSCYMFLLDCSKLYNTVFFCKSLNDWIAIYVEKQKVLRKFQTRLCPSVEDVERKEAFFFFSFLLSDVRNVFFEVHISLWSVFVFFFLIWSMLEL